MCCIMLVQIPLPVPHPSLPFFKCQKLVSLKTRFQPPSPSLKGKENECHLLCNEFTFLHLKTGLISKFVTICCQNLFLIFTTKFPTIWQFYIQVSTNTHFIIQVSTVQLSSFNFSTKYFSHKSSITNFQVKLFKLTSQYLKLVIGWATVSGSALSIGLDS